MQGSSAVVWRSSGKANLFPAGLFLRGGFKRPSFGWRFVISLWYYFRGRWSQTRAHGTSGSIRKQDQNSLGDVSYLKRAKEKRGPCELLLLFAYTCDSRRRQHTISVRFLSQIADYIREERPESALHGFNESFSVVKSSLPIVRHLYTSIRQTAFEC